jgi:hypothetical protein
MPVLLKEVLSEFPKERQKLIQQKAIELIGEFKTLLEFKKSMGLRQKD